MIIISFVIIFLLSSGCLDNKNKDSDKLSIIILNGSNQNIVVNVTIREFAQKVDPTIKFKDSISFPANNSYNHDYNYTFKDGSYIILVDIIESDKPNEFTISDHKLYTGELRRIDIEYYYQSNSVDEPDPQPRLEIWINGIVS